MQLSHLKTLHVAQSGIARVPSLTWSANNKRLAVADHARFVHLFDENGERRDKFALKSSDGKENKTFTVRGMAFSPDSVKLAIAQSDYIVSVYKLGLGWGERKSICNKFPQQSPVTCMCWPSGAVTGQDAFVFGTQEGKVKLAMLKTNKVHTIYSHESPVVSLAASPDGTMIVSGHQDGSLMRYVFETEEGNSQSGASKLATHGTTPYALAWGESLAAGGNDCKVTFYDRNGRAMQTFDFEVGVDKDIGCAAFNPSGHTLAVGTSDRIRVFNYNMRARKWEEGTTLELENAHTITSVTWKCDGSRLVVGTLCGAVDIFDACLKRYRLRGAFEFTYVSHNQVIVRRLSTGTRIVLKSHLGYEIQRVNVHKDRFLVAHTATTLLVGDLGTCKLSEVSWQLSGREQFIFDNPQVCMVFVAGELCLVEYGRNEILGTCRTDNSNMHRISVRLHEVAEGSEEASRKAIAYLIDRQTIQVDDLVSGIAAARISHTFRVDWIELNHRASKLLFRDKQRQLILYDLATQTKTTLLNYCSYVQWVPESDVVVAQNRTDLCVWYSIDNPDKVSVVPIKGEVEGIERTNGKTEVIVDEGVNTVAYGLEENLIDFGTAMEDKDYDRACDMLDNITLSPETDAMWQNLSTIALAEMKLYIAERCYAALGDVAKARALKRINEMAQKAAKESGGKAATGYDHYTVRAELYIVSKEFKRAEQVYLENGQVDKAIEMWDELYRFEESIAVAESRNHADAGAIRTRYYNWLTDTMQEEKAGELREHEGKHLEAINLYLRGGVPSRAAACITAHNVKPEQQLLEAVASALFKSEVFESAGDFFEKLKMDERAIDAYKRGHVYRRAVELARRAFPTTVVTLEDSWGDYLVAQKQVDQAINHYIEAHQYSKAIDAAINSRQWGKAVNIIETQNVGGASDPTVQKFYKQIGTHYESSQQLADAEKYYIKGGAINEAVEMYSRRGLTDHMYRVAQRHLTQEQIVQLFVAQAKQLESKGDYAGAEQIYVKVNEPDKAIVMYKKARDFTNMIRLVAAFRSDLVVKTHLNLGAQFEKEKNYKLAEQHYVSGKDWGKATSMYREINMWDDAVRVAKVHGGAIPAKQVVLVHALSLAGNNDAVGALALLNKFTLVDAGIEAALEAQKFDIALSWAQTSLPAKLPYVFLKNAMYWEDQGEFRMAEDAFTKAGKPREAIEMYVHQHEFESAMRVAEGHDPAGIPTVCVAHGRMKFQQGSFKEAEVLLLRANSPQLLLRLYMEARMLPDAQRIAREYCPGELSSISTKIAASNNDPLQAGAMLEENGDFVLAIESYLKCTTEHTNDVNQLVAVWTRAVKLTMQHARHNLKDTLKVAVQKMIDAGHCDAGAKCLEDAEDYKGAITVYVRGGKYEQAEALAARISPELVDYVKRARVQAAIDSNTATGRDELDNLDQDEAIKAHIASNDWDKVMRLARQMGEEQTLTHAAMYVKHLLKEANVVKALDVIQRDGIDTQDFRFFKVFMDLALQVISQLPAANLELAVLHDGLYNIVENMKKTGQPDADIEEVARVLEVFHVYATAQTLRRQDMNDTAGLLMCSLPRYVDVIPADKAYFDAGNAARESGQEPTGFVLLNRFLDITDKIDEGERDTSTFDHSDFTTSDFPYNFGLPATVTVPEAASEDAKDWVLMKSVDSGFDPSLPTMTEPKSGTLMYTGALRAPGMSDTFDACAVSGMPVLSTSAKVRCKKCARPAIQEYWNKYLLAEKSCPWCKTPQNVEFKM
jgi:intraflagellar transport protein 172